MIILAAKSPLSSFLPKNVILFRRQFLFPLRICVLNWIHRFLIGNRRIRIFFFSAHCFCFCFALSLPTAAIRIQQGKKRNSNKKKIFHDNQFTLNKRILLSNGLPIGKESGSINK